MRQRQWLWQPRGWQIMVTVGRSWGCGFMVLGRNGTDIYFGPVVLSIAPPLPKDWGYMTREQIDAEKENSNA